MFALISGLDCVERPVVITFEPVISIMKYMQIGGRIRCGLDWQGSLPLLECTLRFLNLFSTRNRFIRGAGSLRTKGLLKYHFRRLLHLLLRTSGWHPNLVDAIPVSGDHIKVFLRKLLFA